jgi:hypothetical protein
VEKSEHFGFNLPSSNTDDVVDVNQISDNFRTIDRVLNEVKENAGSGVSSWNDLTDKPFSDEGIKTATLDYNNLPDVKIVASEEITLYKVTDDILSENVLKGSHLTAVTTNANGETVTNSLEISGFPASNEYEFGKLFANAVVEGLIFLIAIATKTGEYTLEGGSINISETGTYFALQPIGNETPNTMSLDYEDIKPLDIKFIPYSVYTEIDRRIENYIDEALGGDY